MNSDELTDLIATGLDAAVPAVEILPFGTEKEMNHPGAVVQVSAMEEHEILLGTFTGTVECNLYTIPADTTFAAHAVMAEDILAWLCDQSKVGPSLGARYSIPEIDGVWDARSLTAESGGIRASQLAVSLVVVQLT